MFESNGTFQIFPFVKFGSIKRIKILNNSQQTFENNFERCWQSLELVYSWQSLELVYFLRSDFFSHIKRENEMTGDKV